MRRRQGNDNRTQPKANATKSEWVSYGIVRRTMLAIHRSGVMTIDRTAGVGTHVFVSGISDVDWARHTVHELALREGFTEARAVALATAVTEIARNIVVHAGRGKISFTPVTDGQRRGIVAVARDEGPGIPDIARALQDGYSTAGSLGMGLSGAKRLVDAFQIESVVGAGVTVTLTHWSSADPRHDE
jgi:serine/threonine-protein kinase RsbT